MQSLGGIEFAAPINHQMLGLRTHLNLEEGLPTEVEDAYPVPYKGREIQSVLQYERNGDDDQILIEPRFEYGIAPNTQVRLSVPFTLGDGANDIQDVGLEVFYNFNAESLSLPAFAVAVSADFLRDQRVQGVDPTVKLLATKTIGMQSRTLAFESRIYPKL